MDEIKYKWQNVYEEPISFKLLKAKEEPKIKFLDRYRYSGKGRPKNSDYDYLTLGQCFRKTMDQYLINMLEKASNE